MTEKDKDSFMGSYAKKTAVVSQGVFKEGTVNIDVKRNMFFVLDCFYLRLHKKIVLFLMVRQQTY